jgi:integrase
MRSKLSRVAALFGESLESFAWKDLRDHSLDEIRTRLIQQELAPSTINATLAACKGVAKAAWRLRLISSEEYSRIREVRPAVGERLPQGKEVPREERRAVSEVCSRDENRNIGLRDSALIGLMFTCGLRRHEAAGVRLEDFDAKDGSLKILGKANKQRVVFLAEGGGARQALDDWLEVRGDSPGPLFSRVNKSGKVSPELGLSVVAIHKRIKQRCAEAGVGDVASHDLRRTYVSICLANGVDLPIVARACGHANVQTTATYDRRPVEEQRTASSKAPAWPYTRTS